MSMPSPNYEASVIRARQWRQREERVINTKEVYGLRAREAAGGGSHQYKRGLWTEGEDKILTEYVKDHGKGHWNRIAKKIGLKRSGKSCRLRWVNYLSPDVKRENFSEQEDDLIIRLHKLLGNRWCLIAGRIPGRTDSHVKNYWNTHLSKQNGYAKKQRIESYLSSLDNNSTPYSKVLETIITKATKSAEQKKTYGLPENKNLIGDASFSNNADAIFADGQNGLTWGNELERQMSTYPSLMQDSDGFLLYDCGWNGTI